jgi:phosphoserine phosphatase
LVATPPHPPLQGKQIQQVGAALRAAGASVGEPLWLAEAIAADLPFDGIAPQQARDVAEAVLVGQAVDAIAQMAPQRRKKLLLADMDSTIIEQECLDELADAVGLKAETAAITERAMRGELDFAAALKERVANLRNLPLSALENTKARITFMPGGRQLVQTMRAHGAQCHLVSGGFRFFTSYVAGVVGFNSEHGNRLLVANDKLTGAVAEPILDKHAKLALLNKFTTELSLTVPETMAVGDGANDLPMLQAAGLGIAFRAKPKVNEQAAARVRYSDLTALLYAQGYALNDIQGRN